MGVQRLLLLVEGPHDLEFCARLLALRGFQRIKLFTKLEKDFPEWKPLVPKSWPKADDMLARHPVPVFFSNPDGQSVAIVSALGDSQLVTKLRYSLKQLDRQPDAVGLLLDADDQVAPVRRHAGILDALAASPDQEAARLRFDPAPGQIQTGPPITGVFVLPDNSRLGTLEDLLLLSGEKAYPGLHRLADAFVSAPTLLDGLSSAEAGEFGKPAGKKKSHVAAMASVLKPGKAIQVSIQDNRWLESASLSVPEIGAVKTFLDRLLGF